MALSSRGVVLALPKPSKSTISHYRLFHGVLAVCRVITVTDFDSRVCFCLSGVRVKLSMLLLNGLYLINLIRIYRKDL